MEKLIELLNEYKKIKGYDGDTKIINYNTNTLSFTNEYSLLDYEIVIGKRYGFIKRLVDNDKIDRKKLEIRPFSDELVYSDSDCTVYRSDTTYEMLLMLLAISDTPIDDLISYLK